MEAVSLISRALIHYRMLAYDGEAKMFFFILERLVKSVSCGTRPIETLPYQFYTYSEQSVICSNFALLFPAPSVAVSLGLITSAAATNTRRRVAGGVNDNSAYRRIRMT